MTKWNLWKIFFSKVNNVNSNAFDLRLKRQPKYLEFILKRAGFYVNIIQNNDLISTWKKKKKKKQQKGSGQRKEQSCYDFLKAHYRTLTKLWLIRSENSKNKIKKPKRKILKKMDS